MNPLLESELNHRGQNFAEDREISLGPGTILGIFFGLVLVCGCFFGFGYSVGRRSAQTAPPAVITSTSTAAGIKGAVKPAPGSAGLPALPDAEPNITPSAPLPQTSRALPSDAMIAGEKPAASAVAAAAAAAAPSAAPSAGSFLVQVAAVSTQQIADIEVAALRKDGYAVVVRHEPQDNLFHVQIGPFSDKKDAEAMRQRVVTDGFNAIVK